MSLEEVVTNRAVPAALLTPCPSLEKTGLKIIRFLCYLICAAAVVGCASAHSGDEAQSLYETILQAEISPQDKFANLHRAAGAGYGPAQNHLASLYAGFDAIAGLETSRDYKAAARWALRHVENPRLDHQPGRTKDHSRGLLAWLFLYGHVSGAPDYGAARIWAEPAAKTDNTARMVLWKIYEGGLGTEKDRLKSEYWKLKFQSPSTPLATMGGPDWSFERMLLLCDLVVTGRATGINVLPLVGRGSGTRSWVELELAVDEIVRNTTGASVEVSIKVIASTNAENLQKIRLDFLNKPLIYPISRGTYALEQPRDWAPRAPYHRLLINAGADTPLELDLLPGVRGTLARIAELGFDR